MPTTKRTFIAGRMNLDTDERLLQDGEYREAHNIDVINSEGSDVGAIEKNLSNKQLTFFSIGANVYDLGKYEDKKNSKLYWFSLSDNGAYFFEWDDNNQVQSIVLADTRPEETRVLKLSKDYMITGIVKIYAQDPKDDLILCTDDNIEPLCINVERAKTYGENGFEKEDIYLIKKPPAFAPKCRLIFDGTPENYIEDKFFTFAYRYRYLDGEYSALSALSIYQFDAKGYNIDYFEAVNKGMVNAFNAINIKFNTGDHRVTDIQIIAKQSNSNTPYIIETFNKSILGWSDNSEENFNFYNNKQYIPLPEKELFRAYDNVPRQAKALTESHNIPLFGNYLENYNILDANGNPINFLHSLTYNTYSLDSLYDFTTNFDNTTNSVFLVDEPNQQVLLSGYSIELTLAFEIEGVPVYTNSFQFIMERDYTNFSQLINDTDFEEFITAINNDILNNYNADSAYDIGAGNVITQNPSIVTSYNTSVLSITLNPLIVDVDGGPSNPDIKSTLFTANSTAINVFKTGNGKSCKTNRNYQVDLVYKDEFKRASTVLTSLQDTVYIPQIHSDNSNKLQISIPHTAPYWAKYYALAVKTKPLSYNNIIVTQFYQDGNFTWCLLQGDNKDKVKAGDLLIPKSAPNIIAEVQYISVLDVQYKEKDFIEGNQDNEGNDLIEPTGVYMKIRPSGINMDASDIDVYSDKDSASAKGDNYPRVYLDLFSKFEDSTLTHLAIPQGTYIYLKLHVGRKQNSNGWNRYTYEKEFFANTNYDTIESWFNDNLLSGNKPINFEYTVEGQSQDAVDLQDNISIVDGANGTKFLEFISNRRGSASRSAYVTGEILIRVGQGEYVFETHTKDIEQEAYFETQEFAIENGYHLGNVQNQDANNQAIVELDFFNCFVFGNGVESYQVRDGVTSNFLNIDTRPNAVSIEPYKEIRRFADWTYGEAFIESTGINGLNVFNLSTANWREGYKQYGSIQILHARDTDIISIQEHKAFKVLFGKDLILTAQGEPVVSKTPEILGQPIPFKGDNGIGLHPESWITDAYRGYYFCPDSNTPIRLSLDGTEEINYGLEDWFRDLTMTSYGSKKLGGYDPYKKMYVLHSETPLIPTFNASCGNTIYREITNTFNYTLNLNNLVGDIVLNYNIIEGEVAIQTNYYGNIYSFPGLTGNGSITVPRNDLSSNVLELQIAPNPTAKIQITNLCPTGVALKMVHIVLCDEEDLNKTIINRHSWGASPIYSRNILFETTEINNFISENGIEGVGKFPINGESITMYAYKSQLNTGTYLADLGNSMAYLVTDSNYQASDIETILSNATYLETTQTLLGSESTLDQGSFVFNRPTENHNLYMIWDYRNTAITNQTNIIIYFDSSGSMNSTLSPLEEMRDTLLKSALLPVYNYDEALYDSNVTIISDATERTLDMLNIGGDTPEGNVIVMIFQDEANPIYHTGFFEFNDTDPRTATYDSDLATLRGRLDGFSPNYYKSVIFQVTPNAGGTGFKDFITAIQTGTGNYTGANGLSDRNEITYRFDINEGDTAQYYLDQITDALSDFGIEI